jgi:hypothetical protein
MTARASQGEMGSSDMVRTAERRQPGGRRQVRVRCVRALSAGQSGWLVRWIDYEQPVWRQCMFFREERDARALVQTLRTSRHLSGGTPADEPCDAKSS